MKIFNRLVILLVLINFNLLYSQDNAAAAAKEEEVTIKGELIVDDEAGLSDDEKARKKDIIKQEAMWKNPDFVGYNKAFEDLHKLSKAFANNKYRLALSAYQSGMNSILKMRENVEQFRKEQAEKKRLDEKWYWQKIDRRANEERYVQREKMAAKLAAVTYFTKAINHLDDIKNADLREEKAYKTLLSSVYRAWIIAEFDTQNYPQCIPILELYLELDANEKEYPAHKYLASCYSFEENTMKKYKGGSDDQIQKLKNKKNMHLLRATELKYGKGSIEYKHIVDLVNKDEVIAVTP
ncbi:MAG: hypothetical protein EBS19_07770 [Spirochaetia bacterium]|jgi:hypothetical protein|nr:hypothetical protein [Spirochaetia bacterium]